MTGKKQAAAGFYGKHFTRAEMADLDRALGDSLRGEIRMLRVVMRRFFERTASEADDLKALSDALRVLGLSCSRLATVVQAERGMQDQRVGDLETALSRSLAALMEEFGWAGLNHNGDEGGCG